MVVVIETMVMEGRALMGALDLILSPTVRLNEKEIEDIQTHLRIKPTSPSSFSFDIFMNPH